ncbi:MAG TPA: hypothetical protein VMY42_07960 [Thermoguttaceae bacterium]|nr:hypothetical protein [Thermoguttaceae bacterium]
MQKHQQDVFQSWAKFLNPASLKLNLIIASLFLAAYETLRNSIIEQIRAFFTNGFNQEGCIVDPKYQRDVLSRHKSPLRASLLWFREMHVVDDSDIELVDRIREHRNQLAHDLPKFIATNDADINVELIGSIYQLVTRIDRWWVREVEIPTNPDFDDQDVAAIPDAGITSGNMMFLQLMIQIATGDDADAEEMYSQFMQVVEKHAVQTSA